MLDIIITYGIIEYIFSVKRVRNMSVKEYLETTPVFTIDDFKESFPTVTGYNLLSRSVKAGKVLRITRGLYASGTGRFAGLSQDRYAIASKLASDVVFAYHAALELHGVAHSTGNTVQYYSSVKRKPLVFQGNMYKQYPFPADQSTTVQTIRARAFGEISVTTKEQTVMDCLAYIGRGGGAEEALRSISAFPYIDISPIKENISTLNGSAIARIGWLLEQKQEAWHINDNDLAFFQSSIGGNAYKFVSHTEDETGWSKNWNLILPTSEDKMKAWLE